MFTGIIETSGIIKSIKKNQSNLIFEIASPLSSELKPDQSVAHDGVCLTITSNNNKSHFVTAIKETLERTILQHYKTGSIVNLERSLMIGSRLDGHFVQGHIDCKSIINQIINHDGSVEIVIELDKKYRHLVVEKGSISINGVSLTVAKLRKKAFSVILIPYTLDHTNLKTMRKGQYVNVEFDMLGKYINRLVK